MAILLRKLQFIQANDEITDLKIEEKHIALQAKAMATDSSTLAWKIPLTEEPGGLQSIGSQGVRHD